MSYALVLAGGGARGAFQVGMLDILVNERHLDFQIIRGVSVGALNAAFLAQAAVGQTTTESLGNLQAQVHQLVDIWTQDLTGDHDVYAERPGGWAGFALGADSLYSLEPLKRLLARYLSNDRLLDAGRNFTVGAVSLVSTLYTQYGPDDPDFVQKILASAAIPAVFPFVDTGKDVLVDGGVRNITPLGDVFSAQPDEIYVLLTSQIEHTDAGNRGVPGETYNQWSDDWLGTKISGLDVLKRAVDIVSDQTYLSDLAGALDWNAIVQKIEALSAFVADPVVPEVVRRTIQDLRDTLTTHVEKRYVPINVLAPQQWYGQRRDNDLLDFSPPSIQEAMEHGRWVARDSQHWYLRG